VWLTFMKSGLAIFVFMAWGAAGVLSLYAKYAATIRPRLRTLPLSLAKPQGALFRPRRQEFLEVRRRVPAGSVSPGVDTGNFRRDTL
jgi:hypothetical protein